MIAGISTGLLMGLLAAGPLADQPRYGFLSPTEPFPQLDADLANIAWPTGAVETPAVTALDLASQQVLWRRELREPRMTNLLLSRRFVIYEGLDGTGGLRLVWLDRADGQVRHEVAIPASADNLPPELYAERWLVAGEGRVFDAEDFRELGSLPGMFDRWLHLAVATDACLVDLCALREGGAPTWRLRRTQLPELKTDRLLDCAELQFDFVGPGRVELLWTDGVRVIAGVHPNEVRLTWTLMCADLEAQRVVWRIDVPHRAPLAVRSAGGVTQVPADFSFPDAPILVIDADTGAAAPDPAVTSPQRFRSWFGGIESLQLGERVVHLAPDRAPQSLLCTDAATGRLLWQKERPEVAPRGVLALNKKRLRADAATTAVVAEAGGFDVYDLESGQLLWTIDPEAVGLIKARASTALRTILQNAVQSEDERAAGVADDAWRRLCQAASLVAVLAVAWLLLRLRRRT